MRFSGRILKETKLKIFFKSPDIFRDGKLLVLLHPMSLSVPLAKPVVLLLFMLHSWWGYYWGLHRWWGYYWGVVTLVYYIKLYSSSVGLFLFGDGTDPFSPFGSLFNWLQATEFNANGISTTLATLKSQQVKQSVEKKSHNHLFFAKPVTGNYSYCLTGNLVACQMSSKGHSGPSPLKWT